MKKTSEQSHKISCVSLLINAKIAFSHNSWLSSEILQQVEPVLNSWSVCNLQDEETSKLEAHIFSVTQCNVDVTTKRGDLMGLHELS